MNDMQISKDLALAIGWNPTDVLPNSRVIAKHDLMSCWVWLGYSWKRFDYRDPTVIWPIAVRYHAFPYKLKFPAKIEGKWNCFLVGDGDHIADTPEKAIALAVIRSSK